MNKAYFQHTKRNELVASILLILILTPNFIAIIGGIIGLSILSNFVSFILCGLLVPLFLLFKTKHIIVNNNYFWLLTFILSFLLSYFYTISTFASAQKFLNILYSIIIPCSIVAIAFSFLKADEIKYTEKQFTKWGYKISCVLIPVIAILFFFGFRDSEDSREFIIGIGNPIWASRYIGLLILFIVYYSFYYKNGKQLILNIFFCIIGLYLMLCTGSRAPLISLLATGTLLIWSKLSNRDKFTYILLVIIGTCYFILFSERFTSGSSDYSNQARILLISKAFECEFNHYIGAGIGSFNYLTTGIDELYYPHNLEIETYIETGIIGLVILALLLYQLFRYRGIDIFNYLLLYYFINAQFSGDIAGNNMFFVIATISIARHTTNYEKNRILLQK